MNTSCIDAYRIEYQGVRDIYQCAACKDLCNFKAFGVVIGKCFAHVYGIKLIGS